MTANEVERALAMSAPEVGAALLALSEDQWFERKGAQIAVKDLAVPLVALANAEGGVVVVGLGNGRVRGISAAGTKINALRQVAVDFTVPPVRARVETVECVTDTGEFDQLLIFRVEPGERVHELTNGDCYLRVGDESRRLNFLHRQELEFDKGQSQYDGLALAGVGIGDLDDVLLQDYRQSTGAQFEMESLLKARSLMTHDGSVANGAYLLFAPHPQDRFPQAQVRVIKFLGSERGTGSRFALEEGADVRVEGPIPRAIDEAGGIIDELVPRRRSLGASGTFEPHPIVPRDVWLEGLVNAVIHRSYSLAGDHIRVEIYSDRIEIESPGRFPGLADPTRPLEISRFARNPRIARVCADLMIGQELGEGIKRMYEEMRSLGLADPIYRQGQGSVRLILQAIPRIDGQTLARLPRGAVNVLDLMRQAGRGLSTGDIADALGISRPVVIRRLNALQDEGLVRWIGKSPKDPRAFWELDN